MRIARRRARARRAVRFAAFARRRPLLGEEARSTIESPGDVESDDRRALVVFPVLMTPLTQLEWLEIESVHVLSPGPRPFPFLNVETTWKFREMYSMHDRMVVESGMPLIVSANPDGQQRGINPFAPGPDLHTKIWKSHGLE